MINAFSDDTSAYKQPKARVSMSLICTTGLDFILRTETTRYLRMCKIPLNVLWHAYSCAHPKPFIDDLDQATNPRRAKKN